MSGAADVRHIFRAVVESAGRGGAAVRVPSEVATPLGGLKQMRVVGTIDGTEFRSSTMSYGGALYMGVSKAMRAAAGVAIGDEVEVVVRRHDAPRVLEIPPELEAALAAEPKLRARFERLAFSHRRAYAESIAEAKRPETKARRLAAALDFLRGLGQADVDRR
jgi:hypothetical protein